MTHKQVTPADIAASIASAHYFTAWEGAQLAYWSDSDPKNPKSLDGEPEKDGPLSMLTFCVLVTKNGHTVVGESQCQDPAKFDADIGKSEARKDAINKLWPMVVYAAREKAQEGK